jgi:hypothetical protein
MPHELKEKPYVSILDDTNILNVWQQHPRYSYLNIDLLNVAIRKDLYSVRNNPGICLTPTIGLTCIDQISSLSSVGYILDNKVRFRDICQLKKVIENKTDLEIKYLSNGPTRKDIIEIDNE